MSKRSVYTTITPLPPGVTRETVLETLHTHTEMIDLNPLVEERHPIKPPAKASPEEYHCQWYEITDKVQYLPGGLYTGKVSFHACFHDLADGIQTHVYAPMGLEIRGRWTIGGSIRGEPQVPVEIGKGIPSQGLYLREDSHVKCNILMAGIVKRNLKQSHTALVARILARAQMQDATTSNDQKNKPSATELIHSSQQTGFARLSHSSPQLTHTIHYSPLGSPNYPPPDQSVLYPPPLRTRSHDQMVYPQTGNPYALNPLTEYPYPPQYDPRFSSQMPVPYHLPNYTVAPAYSVINPHWQPQIPSYVNHQRVFSAPPEAVSPSPRLIADEKKESKGGVDPAGPPAHPVTPSELPAQLDDRT